VDKIAESVMMVVEESDGDLSTTEQQRVARRASVVGMHFFSPANVMKLLENVQGQHSSQEAVATAMALGKRVGKVNEKKERFKAATWNEDVVVGVVDTCVVLYVVMFSCNYRFHFFMMPF
jgi:hypothetical protein